MPVFRRLDGERACYRELPLLDRPVVRFRQGKPVRGMVGAHGATDSSASAAACRCTSRDYARYPNHLLETLPRREWVEGAASAGPSPPSRSPAGCSPPATPRSSSTPRAAERCTMRSAPHATERPGRTRSSRYPGSSFRPTSRISTTAAKPTGIQLRLRGDHPLPGRRARAARRSM